MQAPGGSQAPAAPPIERAPAATTAPASAARAGPYRFDAARGASLYAANCVACHQATDTGLAGAFPPLKGSPAVLAADPAAQIDTILHGARRADRRSHLPRRDAAVRCLAERCRRCGHRQPRTKLVGNQAKPVTADQVKAARAKRPAK